MYWEGLWCVWAKPQKWGGGDAKGNHEHSPMFRLAAFNPPRGGPMFLWAAFLNFDRVDWPTKFTEIMFTPWSNPGKRPFREGAAGRLANGRVFEEEPTWLRLIAFSSSICAFGATQKTLRNTFQSLGLVWNHHWRKTPINNKQKLIHT